MGVGEHVRRFVDQPGRDAGGVQQVEDLAGRPGAGPVGDALVEDGHVPAAGLVAGEARVVGQLRLAHGGGQAAKHRVLVGGDQHLAVAGG